MVDETYLKKAHMNVQEGLYDTLYNMSFLVEDSAGLITDKNAKYLTKNLAVTSDRSVSLMDVTTTDKYSSVLGNESLTPKLTDSAYHMYATLKLKDSVRVKAKSYFDIDNLLSTTLSTSSDLSPASQAYVSYSYLELYSLYISLIEYNAGEVFSYTTEDLNLIINNIRKIILNVCATEKTGSAYDLINVLKHIQRTILFVRANMKIVLR